MHTALNDKQDGALPRLSDTESSIAEIQEQLEKVEEFKTQT